KPVVAETVVKPKLKPKALPTIQLLPHQIAHVEKLRGVLLEHPVALDFSMMGTGKTFTSSFLGLMRPEFQFQTMIVIAPVSVKPKWLAMQRDYRIPLVKCLGYQELRSVKCKQPKHGLLYRRDYTV